MDVEESQKPTSHQMLAEENSTLRQELEALKAEKKFIWTLLVDISRRLQVSSASIKAAVSSLLSYDILWDFANQHEFLETIDASTDQAAQLVLLLSLSFRLEAERLELKQEPHALQEILSNVQAESAARFPGLELELSMPLEGKPVWVDYEYLSIALNLFIEVFQAYTDQKKLLLHVSERPECWTLDFDGLDPAMIRLLNTIIHCQVDNDHFAGQSLSPEHILSLHIVCKLFHLQGIWMEIKNKPDSQPQLSIFIPVVSSK
jgi:signal transduction histidine kinase